MPQLPAGVHEPSEGDLELGGGEDSSAARRRGRALEREADRILRAAAGDNPREWHESAGILTDARQRTIRRHERTASARPALWRAWYGQDATEKDDKAPG
jgi:hypothetical protein